MITINGAQFQVVKSFVISVKGSDRTVFQVKKPNGKKIYEAVNYANGEWSSVLPA